MELRGFEPLALPAEMGSELQRMVSGVVTQVLRDLQICVGVLRRVTVLAMGLSIPVHEASSVDAGLSRAS